MPRRPYSVVRRPRQGVSSTYRYIPFFLDVHAVKTTCTSSFFYMYMPLKLHVHPVFSTCTSRSSGMYPWHRLPRRHPPCVAARDLVTLIKVFAPLDLSGEPRGGYIWSASGNSCSIHRPIIRKCSQPGRPCSMPVSHRRSTPPTAWWRLSGCTMRSVEGPETGRRPCKENAPAPQSKLI